jgi:hypothetical protein
MLQAIERSADRRRRAELGVDDDDVLRRRRPPAELRQDRRQRLARIAPPAVLRQHVPRAPQLIVTLLEPQLADVPRDRGLGGQAALAGQGREQIVLRPDPPPRDEARNQALPFGLREASRIRLHGRRIGFRTPPSR